MKRSGRTQTCTRPEAKRRLTHAQQFLQVAEIAADDQREDGSLEYGNAAAALAVLAGIAATDAICCSSLGRRSRADDHDQAAQLVLQVDRIGTDAAKALRGLIRLKNDAQYGFYNVGQSELTGALRRAQTLIDLAGRVVP